jgi:hypothetical protein
VHGLGEPMKRRIPMKSSAEYDALTSWRHVLIYVQRAGVKASIRTGFNRRERRTAKDDIRKGREDQL